MGSYDGNQLNDTYAMLQKAELERRQVKKQEEKRKAALIVEDHNRRHNWPEGDLDLVMGSLGLDHEVT